MSIINREKAPSEQRWLFSSDAILATGITYPMASVPWPGMLEQIVLSASGISGSPFVIPEVHRFIVGTGFTALNGGSSVGSTTTVFDFGVSGLCGVSLIAGGISLLAGDLVVLRTGGSNAAATATINVVVRCVQDIKSHYGATYLP